MLDPMVNSIALAKSEMRRNIAAIALATAAVAILDGSEELLYCKLILHVTPKEMFVYIASALLGTAKAISLGWPAVLLGIILHTGISLIVVIAYFLLSRSLRVFRSQPFLMGAVFGVAVNCVMHFVVLPLTAVPRIIQPQWKLTVANQLLAHVFMVGIPAAVILRRFSTHSQGPAGVPALRIDQRS
jgi:hypothetical protein